MRFFGISVAFAFNLVVPGLIAETRALQADIHLFAFSWLAAVVVFWANRRSRQVARLVGLDIVFLDMPFVFFLQSDVVGRNPGAAAPAVWSVVFYMLLVMAASFSLKTARILLAVGVGSALELTPLSLAHVDRQFLDGTLGVMGGVAAFCAYNTWRTTSLVRSVATEQRRRERLGRYFSSHVATRSG
jgi:hypothetical protein